MLNDNRFPKEKKIRNENFYLIKTCHNKLFARFYFVPQIELEYIRSLRYIHLYLDIQENIFYKIVY
jgi:hypothetical protein